ncbi:oxygenase MpaB family protein [Melittangium boletus]|uniref:oxygenase MpaB family protein n=1 Tax=Melittangium boletus TaxID=83453 RepID=UPI003DA3707F
MPSSLWTHDFMDEMRLQGDPLADGVIEKLFADGSVASVNQLLHTLVGNDDLPSNKLPVDVQQYLLLTRPVLTRADVEKLRRAQEVFELFGPEVMMILGFYSLPAAYAARRGVQVLARTGNLSINPVRRVFETAQMVVDVMSRGGLEPEGRGVRTTQKVRLLHAAVRRLIRKDRRGAWAEQELGVPINQEDMAGTLMTFSYVVLEGLKALRIELTAEQRDAWLHAWKLVGRTLGVHERLLPDGLDEARMLTRFIRERQVEPSAEGVALTAALIEGMKAMVPAPLEGLPASMIHFFLDQDQWQGLNVADMLRVPQPDWTTSIAQAITYVGGFTDWVGDHTFLPARLVRLVSKDIVEAMLRTEVGGKRALFQIPEELRGVWNLKARGTRPSGRHLAVGPDSGLRVA